MARRGAVRSSKVYRRANPESKEGAVGERAGRWLRSGVVLAIVWVVTRVLLYLLFLVPAQRAGASGDFVYYALNLTSGGTDGTDLGGTLPMPEYPTPTVAILSLAWSLTRESFTPFSILLCALMAACDVTLAWALHRYDTRRGGYGAAYWIISLPLVGPIVYARFDLIPSVLLGVALLTVLARPALAGAMLAAGAAVKLWPAAVLPALLAARGRGRRVVLGFVACGAALAAAGTGYAGLERLASPLTFQGGRGLGIESIFATPFMVARALGVDYLILLEFGSRQIHGPYVEAAIVAATLAQVIGLAAVCGLALRAWWWADAGGGRSADRHTEQIVASLAVAIVAVLLTTGKVLSPQYLLWLLAPLAVLVGVARGRAVRWIALLGLVAAALTLAEFPVAFGQFLTRYPGRDYPLAVAVLTTRNVALLALTVVSVVHAARLTARPTSGPTSRPAGPTSEQRQEVAEVGTQA
jgi:glycosyl transferase family 87